MKPNGLKRMVIVTFGLVYSGMCVFAQTSSSYFVDGSYNRYRLNPALTPERAFVSLPVLGGTSVQTNMNAGLANFIYESKSKPGELTTFMSGDVDSRKFLNGLPDAVRLNANLDIDVLGFGFGTSEWYFWLDSRIRSYQGVSIPDDMFRFLKAGMSKGEYFIRDLNVTTTNYVQTSLGFQIKPVENLSVGASTNILLGGAYSKLNIDCMHFRLGPDSWLVNTEATATVSVPDTRVILDEEGKIDDIDSDINGFPGIASYGLSFDLGAEYDLKDIVPGLKVSASVTDMGFMIWKDAQVLKTDRNNTVEFNGITDDGFSDQLSDDAENMARFYECDDNSVTSKFNATVRMGAEYSLSGVKWLSFGELITLRSGLDRLYESRTSVNLKAGNVLDVSGSVAFSNIGAGFGGVFNLHPGGVNLFVGAEMDVLKVNPQFIPLEKFSCNVNFGLRMGLGNRRF